MSVAGLDHEFVEERSVLVWDAGADRCVVGLGDIELLGGTQQRRELQRRLRSDGRTDQDGNRVFRQSGLGDQGLIFRFPDESVYVYWSTDIFEPIDEDNPTWPFSTRDYDATTLLRCHAVGAAKPGLCPAGILRMEDGQASIVVVSRGGEKFTFNFMKDYINAANREVEAVRENDTWIVTVNGEEVYEVPLAAIEGG